MVSLSQSMSMRMFVMNIGKIFVHYQCKKESFDLVGLYYLHSFPLKCMQADSPDLTFQLLFNGGLS